jgi:hypothetical protein
MMRRGLILLCVTAGAATVVAGALSHFGAFMLSVSVTPRHVLAIHFFDARVRFFSIASAGDPIEVSRPVGSDLFVFTPKYRQLGQFVAPRPASDFAWLVGDDETWSDVITVAPRAAIRATGLCWFGAIPLAPSIDGTPEATARFIRLSYWMIAAAFGIAPARLAFARWRRRRRLRRGWCGKCGYDLTGNVSGVCPECGRPIVRAS